MGTCVVGLTLDLCWFRGQLSGTVLVIQMPKGRVAPCSSPFASALAKLFALCFNEAAPPLECAQPY